MNKFKDMKIITGGIPVINRKIVCLLEEQGYSFNTPRESRISSQNATFIWTGCDGGFLKYATSGMGDLSKINGCLIDARPLLTPSEELTFPSIIEMQKEESRLIDSIRYEYYHKGINVSAKIPCIKRVRAIHGWDLKEAKMYVEEIEKDYNLLDSKKEE